MKILVKIKRQRKKTKYKKQGISDFDCFKMITTGRLLEKFFIAVCIINSTEMVFELLDQLRYHLIF